MAQPWCRSFCKQSGDAFTGLGYISLLLCDVSVHTFVLQMMNKVFGGTVHRKSVREDGVFNIALDNTCSVFR